MHLGNGRVIGPTPQETPTMSVNKMPSESPAHHRHATPKPTVTEQPHGRKEAPPQATPLPNVTPGDSPFITWNQLQFVMSVIRTVLGGTGASSETPPILPEDGSTMMAFLLRIERRYTQMRLEPREWGNALIDHLVGPAVTYWMYLRRTIDLSDWATVRRRLLERFHRTMSQSQLLKELAKVRWNGNPKEYTDRFAAVAEQALDFAPDKLAKYYCTGLPTDLRLSITNNGKVKYQSWEQAATAATRFYEAKQSVLELRARIKRAIRAAVHVRGLADAAWPPIHVAAGNPTEEYEVDYVMDQRGSGDAAQYLVKWRGTPEDQATWEPAHHLTGCPALLRAWRRRQRKRLQARNNIGPSEA
ncbi:hypothetical protein ENH_00028900 [Eimeria necatrix]|uniref:Chromo domain-containing protein n=1 Tax=Eimeria necatrix TaxID=51315 RepID=U6MIK5_9EIME|nr:hypothetical protein ENH_00028900 [Eimeria necatrix]CDJ62908.1 hypothetical protein ENH_00028900 [Eimeria necatrix]